MSRMLWHRIVGNPEVTVVPFVCLNDHPVLGGGEFVHPFPRSGIAHTDGT